MIMYVIINIILSFESFGENEELTKFRPVLPMGGVGGFFEIQNYSIFHSHIRKILEKFYNYAT